MAEVLGGLRLQQISIFENVDAAVLGALEPHVKERSYRPSEVVYRTAAWADGLYAIVKGSILVRTEKPGFPVDRFLDLGPGDVFGEAEALEDAPREYTARSVKAAQLLFLPAEILRDVIACHPFVGTLLRTLTIRRRTAQTRARFTNSTRREPRIWVGRDVVLKLGGRMQVSVRLEDLSPNGACFASTPPHWQPGQALSFTLGTPERPDLLHVNGHVRWQELGSVGVVFENGGLAMRQKVEQALKVLVP
jgi:CRP-like cAMP-binding protein